MKPIHSFSYRSIDFSILVIVEENELKTDGKLLLQSFISYYIENYTGSIQNYSDQKGISAPTLKEIDQYIQLNINRKIFIDEIAELIHMSKYHFLREYKLAYGITPYRRVMELRLQHAKKLLPKYLDNMAELAYECGFSDQSHFIRCFKEYFGSTPKEAALRQKS